MKVRFIIATFLSLLLIASCSEKKKSTGDNLILSSEKNIPGDSTLYCLACDGCTDSAVVVLPRTGGDPITLDILKAMETHNVFGRPKIGDHLAIMLNRDKKSVKMLVDINELMGEWGYKVTPKLRVTIGGPQGGPAMPDSVRDSMLKQVEYGFQLNTDRTAKTTGFFKKTMTSDDTSPIIYPARSYYLSWRLFNCKLILTSTSSTNSFTLKENQKTQDDTCDIVLLMRDSLMLGGGGITRGYYRLAYSDGSKAATKGRMAMTGARNQKSKPKSMKK
jgi:hypothetical protein